MAYLELEKITYNPDSSTTMIDSAGYYLQWVYRTADAKKDYYVLPVTKVETDSVNFIRDNTSRAAFKLFVDDSRRLNRKYNQGVLEMTELPKGFARKPMEE